jgi:hypothetical protein
MINFVTFMKHSYNSMEGTSMFMDREEIIRRVDNIIRILSYLDSTHESNLWKRSISKM